MLIQHMMPRHLVHPDEMALGVVNLSDDMVLNDVAKASISTDGDRDLALA
jgi:hypothetical protein